MPKPEVPWVVMRDLQGRDRRVMAHQRAQFLEQGWTDDGPPVVAAVSEPEPEADADPHPSPLPESGEGAEEAEGAEPEVESDAPVEPEPKPPAKAVTTKSTGRTRSSRK